MTFHLYLLCFILGGLGAWFMSSKGRLWGLMDHPNKRSSHQTPIPKGGGIGILAGLCFASISLQIQASLWVPAASLSILSLWGDRTDLSPRIRIVFQFTAALVVLLGIYQISFQWKSFLALPLMIFMVGTTNFYNFMDGINGIAGITGIVGFGLLSLSILFIEADTPFFVLSACVSLSCLGFLPFNIVKTKVFLGDVGSILLGFVFAGIVVVVSKNLFDLVCRAAFLFPFYADELTTMAVRIRDGENLSQPHRRHLYQLLANEYRIPHWKVSFGYGFFQLLIGMSILLINKMGIWVVILTLIFYICVFTTLSLVLRSKVECRV